MAAEIYLLGDHVAMSCGSCGSTEFHCLQTGKVECAGCNTRLVGVFWGTMVPDYLNPDEAMHGTLQ